jgi:hypothetical protein
MLKKLLLFAVIFAALGVVAQERTNTQYAREFQGATVAAKVTAAQAACNSNTAIPCYIVIDADLVATTTGTMPAKCAQCAWIDYRGGAPFVVPEELIYASPATTFTMSAAQAEIGTVFFRRRFDSSPWSQFRLTTACTVSLAAASLRLQYSTDNVTFVDAEAGTTADLFITATGVLAGVWAPLKTTARADLYWRLVVQGGDGTTRSCVSTAIQFK